MPFEGLYRPVRAGLGFTLAADDVSRRTAWALLGEWLVAASVEAPCVADGLVAKRHLLPEDADRLISEAERDGVRSAP